MSHVVSVPSRYYANRLFAAILSSASTALILTDTTGQEWLWYSADDAAAAERLPNFDPPIDLLVGTLAHRWLQRFERHREGLDLPTLARHFGAPVHVWHASRSEDTAARDWLADRIRRGALLVRQAQRLKATARSGKPWKENYQAPRVPGDTAAEADQFASDAELDEAQGIIPLVETLSVSESPSQPPEPDPLAPDDQPATESLGGTPRVDEPSSADNGTDAVGRTTQANQNTVTGGEPVSLATGEEILELTDFTLSAPLGLVWTRTYRTSASAEDRGLGYGWLHPLAQTLELSNDTIRYHNAEGRIITFPKPASGERSHNRAEQLTLERMDAERYRVTPFSGGVGIDFTRIGERFRLSRWVDASGNTLRVRYVDGKPAAIETDHAKRLVIRTDSEGRITAIERDDESRTETLVEYAYDNHGDLIQARDPVGHAEHYTYQNHVIATRALKSGYRFYFEWDHHTPDGRCLRQWGDPIDGEPTYDYRFAYDLARRETTVTDTRGAEHCYRFNERAQVIYHRDAEGGEWHYHYDDQGRLLKRIDPAGESEHFEYDEAGRLLAHTDTTGARHAFDYDEADRPVGYTDPLGGVWSRRYNARGLLAAVTDPLGHTTEYRYNALGLVGEVRAPDGVTTRYIWSSEGRLEAKRDPAGRILRYRYDAQGRLRSIGDGHTQQVFRYDSAGRLISARAPDGATTHYRYNPLGLVAAITDPAGRTTEYRYDGLSQVRERRDPNGTVLRYHYDGERNLIGLTNEAGERYHLAYDRNERLIEEHGFDGRLTRYEYDPRGHLIARGEYDPNSNALLAAIHLRRDATGRLIGVEHDGEHTDYRYDALGRLIEARNPHRRLAWRYDAAGRLIEDWQDHLCIAHHYDPVGRCVRSELPGGDVLDYAFDPAGQLQSVHHNGALITRFQRNVSGRETARRFGNRIETIQLHDPQGRLIGQKSVRRPDPYNLENLTRALLADAFQEKAPVERELHQRLYQYNTAGQLVGVRDSRRGESVYHYDALDRLMQVEGPIPEVFVHDPAHNLLAAAANPDDARSLAKRAQAQGNRLSFFADVHYAYDPHGNRCEERRGKGGRLKTTYHYDAQGQLREVQTPKDHLHFTYDPLGRRLEKRGTQGTTRYLWHGDVLLREQFTPADDNPAHETDRTYLFEPGTFKPLALIDREQTYYYHLDHLGTPLELTDADGELVWAVAYRAYGQLAVQYAQTLEQPLRFQGQYFDEETGLHYNRFRYYDPECGRFLNQDPIGLLGGTNNYQYVPNPTGWVDPLGLTAAKEDPTRTAACLIPTVFAGHGSMRLDRHHVVPEGTSLTVYSWDGASITDDLGQVIERGDVLPDVYKKTFYSGDTIPEYILHPNCGQLCISPISTQVKASTPINELLKPNMGECHWAACTYIAGHENSSVIHDETGIYKQQGPDILVFKGGSWKKVEG